MYRPAVSQDAELYLGYSNEFIHTFAIFALNNNLQLYYAIHNVNNIKIAKLAKLSKKRKDTVRWYVLYRRSKSEDLIPPEPGT